MNDTQARAAMMCTTFTAIFAGGGTATARDGASPKNAEWGHTVHLEGKWGLQFWGIYFSRTRRS